jgi:dTDP-4-amino-4,6-dideoxygalactose transaminase
LDEIHNSKVVLPIVKDWDAHAFHLFSARCSERDRLQQYLTEKGIQTIIHYPIPPHQQECYKAWNGMSLPITELIHQQELSLPISPVMSEDEVQTVIDAINAFQ